MTYRSHQRCAYLCVCARASMYVFLLIDRIHPAREHLTDFHVFWIHSKSNQIAARTPVATALYKTQTDIYLYIGSINGPEPCGAYRFACAHRWDTDNDVPREEIMRRRSAICVKRTADDDVDTTYEPRRARTWSAHLWVLMSRMRRVRLQYTRRNVDTIVQQHENIGIKQNTNDDNARQQHHTSD